MKKISIYFFLFFLLACNKNHELTLEEQFYTTGEEYPGGQTSYFDVSVNAFSNSASNLTQEEANIFIVGNSFFNRNWVKAPSSTEDLDGLGPFFNARSCAACHFKDGRGEAPLNFGEPSVSILYRLSIPGIAEHGAPIPDPKYGGQLANRGLLEVGELGEGDVSISYEEIKGNYPDGTPYSLRKPTYHFKLNQGDFSAGTLFSPRVANQMIGLGLLEAIKEEDLMNIADESDQDADGISGRVNKVWDLISKKMTVGRFGWKANMPNLKQQVAGAFLGDIGITSSLFPDESCTSLQQDCNDQKLTDQPELKESILEKVTFYSSTIAVPVREDAKENNVLRGKNLFHQIKCDACHVSSYTTGDHAIKALSNQKIYPYTDLLLHDMGDDLSDNRPDFLATGKEWRTPPLWGIGLIPIVNGHTQLLHDGRARNVEEAILWHGGEAFEIKENFKKLTKEERESVVAFVNSL